VSEQEEKCKSGSLEHATFRRADAEIRKVEEAAKWRELLEKFLNWLMSRPE